MNRDALQLWQVLTSVFNLPDRCVELNIQLKPGEPPLIEGSFYALPLEQNEQGDLVRALRKFQLKEIETDDPTETNPRNDL